MNHQKELYTLGELPTDVRADHKELLRRINLPKLTSVHAVSDLKGKEVEIKLLPSITTGDLLIVIFQGKISTIPNYQTMQIFEEDPIAGQDPVRHIIDTCLTTTL